MVSVSGKRLGIIRGLYVDMNQLMNCKVVLRIEPIKK